jgi:hypothetical protein
MEITNNNESYFARDNLNNTHGMMDNSFNPAEQNTESLPNLEDTFPGGKFFSLKFHAASGAMEAKADRTKAGIHTLRIEFAIPITKGSKSYDWKNKIAFQITRSDLPKFLMVVLGISKEAKFQHYGANNDKSLTLKFQKSNYGVSLFIQATKGSQNCAMPVALTDTVIVGHFGLTQYIKNFPRLSTEAVLMSFARLAKLEGSATI